MRQIALVAMSCLLVAACATTKPQPAAPSPAHTPAAHGSPASSVPADDLLNATVWVQTTVEHDLVFREIYRDAREHLAAALKDRHWDALPGDERNPNAAKLPPAVILDVDETALDNSPYEARLIRSGKEFDAYSFSQWVKQASAKALPGALAFTRYAVNHGVAVFYISNRSQDLSKSTLENLRKAGFPVAAEDRFLGLGTFVKGCEQIGSSKSCRRRFVARKYRVIMQFGDQIGDFVNVLANTPSGRRDAVQPYLDWIGERWFVLPNPEYGSWEPALFNNDWTLPREQRRAAKRKALHTD